MKNIEKYMSDMQFIGSSIKSLEINNDFVVFPEKSNKMFDVIYERISIDKRDERKNGIIRLDVKVQLSEDERNCNVHLIIEGCFNISSDVSDDDFEKILAINGRALLYSVSRAYITTISSIAFANGSIVLPMMNFVEADKDNQ